LRKNKRGNILCEQCSIQLSPMCPEWFSTKGIAICDNCWFKIKGLIHDLEVQAHGQSETDTQVRESSETSGTE